MEMQVRLMMKSDTFFNWAKIDPVLLKGEVAVVWLNSDEVKLKIGDGERRFCDLPFVSL